MEGKKKAVFIDGASLLYMKDALGIFRLSFKHLMNILSYDIYPSANLDGRAFITLPPSVAQGLSGPLWGYGYDPYAVGSEGQADDRMLIERITAVDTDTVGHIIMVSSDSDFCHVLREKARRGTSITIVATHALDPHNGSQSVGTELQHTIDQGEFSFVELGDFTDRITLRSKPSQPKNGAASAAPQPALHSGNGSSRSISILCELEPDDPERLQIIEAFNMVADKYPQLHMLIER